MLPKMTWGHEDRKLRRRLPVSYGIFRCQSAEWHPGDGWCPQSTCRGLMLTLNIPRTRHPPRGGYSHKVALKTRKPLFSPIVARKITKNSCSSNYKWMDWWIFDLSNWLLSKLLSLLFFFILSLPHDYYCIVLYYYLICNSTSGKIFSPAAPRGAHQRAIYFPAMSAALQMSVKPQPSTMVTHTLLCVLLSLATARVQGLDTVETEDGDPRVGWAVEVSTGHREIINLDSP